MKLDLRKLKVIDIKNNGNLIRFSLGDKNLKGYYGDDWNDIPYEHNADGVYTRFVKAYLDVVLPYGILYAEPKDDYRFEGNSIYSKEMFRDLGFPFAVLYNDKDAYEGSYVTVLSNQDLESRLLLYFEEKADKLISRLKEKEYLMFNQYALTPVVDEEELRSEMQYLKYNKKTIEFNI